MPINGSAMSATLMGLLAGAGFIGEKLKDMCDAIGNGSVMSVAGKTFQTMDTGTVPGIGVGNGVGLMGLVPPMISMTIYGKSVGSFGQPGQNLLPLCDSVANALIMEMAKATLMSNHPLVFVGVGTVMPGTIPVQPSEWGNNVESQGKSAGFEGSQWGNLANAIGVGCAGGFGTATGVVTIAGSPTAPIPVPGAGVGIGSIS